MTTIPPHVGDGAHGEAPSAPATPSAAPTARTLWALAIGLAATGLVVWLLATTAAERDRHAFEAAARQAQDLILDRVETSIALLRGTAGLFAAGGDAVTVDSFRAYVDRLALPEKYPGLLGIGYSARFEAAEREALEERMRRQGHEGFRAWPEGARDELHAILFLEPLDERNRAAIGYDMFTQPVRRAAMERARDLGAASASGVVSLVQEIDARKQPGFLIYLPVYRGGALPVGEDARRAALAGYAYSPIRAVDFLSNAFSHEETPSLGLEVYHGAPGEGPLLYERGPAGGGARFQKVVTIDVAGQPWTFVMRSRATAAEALAMPGAVAAAGIALSLLLAWLVAREGRARHALQRALESERAARAEAERANAMKDQFLATLSHELRTPLNAIIGWTALLRRPELAEDRRLAGVDVIERNARAQARLIEDLLDMSRIVSGKLGIELQSIELGAVAADAIATAAPAAQDKGVRIVTAIGGPVHVRGDPARLLQVAWNLLSNAIKFTPHGGEVRVALHREGDRAVLEVADTGAGIDAEDLGRIFDRFAQADSSTTRRHGGLGLGLAIVRQLVELHHGSVRASSEGRGKGACFRVELPLLPPGEAAAVAGEAGGDLQRLKGVSVLAVDDNQDARELVRSLLESRGARVRLAASAEEALAALAEERPDVLVSDLGMPEMDGYALIRAVRVREPGEGGDVPAVAVTAYAREAERDEALAAGFQRHLVKPVNARELVEAVALLARRA